MFDEFLSLQKMEFKEREQTSRETKVKEAIDSNRQNVKWARGAQISFMESTWFQKGTSVAHLK